MQKVDAGLWQAEASAAAETELLNLFHWNSQMPSHTMPISQITTDLQKIRIRIDRMESAAIPRRAHAKSP